MDYLGGIGQLLTGVVAVILLIQGRKRQEVRHKENQDKLDKQDIKLAAIDHAVNNTKDGEPTLRQTVVGIQEDLTGLHSKIDDHIGIDDERIDDLHSKVDAHLETILTKLDTVLEKVKAA